MRSTLILIFTFSTMALAAPTKPQSQRERGSNLSDLLGSSSPISAVSPSSSSSNTLLDVGPFDVEPVIDYANVILSSDTLKRRGISHTLQHKKDVEASFIQRRRAATPYTGAYDLTDETDEPYYG